MDDNDDDALVTLWLTAVIVVPVGPPIGREITSVVLLFEAFTCCCFGAVIFAAVGFVVVVCCVDDGDDTADVCGVVVAADDNKDGFTVLGIPHIRASVVLTTFRLGLVGSHIFALSPGGIGLLDELLLLRLLAACDGSDDDNDDGNCCANT